MEATYCGKEAMLMKTGIMRSVTFKLVASILSIVIPIILLLISNTIQSRNVLLEQIENTHANMLRSYIAQIDSQLSDAMAYTVNLALLDNAPQTLALNTDPALVEYAKIGLLDELNKKAASTNLIDGFFTQIVERDGHITYLVATNSSARTADRDIIKAYVSQNAGEIDPFLFSGDMQWQLYQHDDTYYLIQMAVDGNGVCAGSYVNLMLLQARFLNEGTHSQLSIIPNEALAATQSTQGERLITLESDMAPFALMVSIQEQEIMNALPFMQKYTQLVSVFLLLMIPLLFLLVQKIVGIPLARLNRAMMRVHDGDLDYRIALRNTSTEIYNVNRTLNHMLDQVQQLKIDIYEEELKSQRAQLRNLQLQVRPHFLINSLNMVYNAVKAKEYDLAQKLLLYSVDYFRYMVKIDEDFVPLHDELAHVKTYMEIQSIRYEGMFSYDIHVDQMVEDMLVPPLVVQTFVENSVKYAMRLTETAKLRIEVQSFEVDYDPYARITISDTGPGYPQQVIDNMESTRMPTDDTNTHIGIANVRRRLDILFDGKAMMKLSNHHGALTELTMPALFAEE